MKMKERKIAGAIFIFAAIIEIICGIADKKVSTILMGISFAIIGTLYLFEKQK